MKPATTRSTSTSAPLRARRDPLRPAVLVLALLVWVPACGLIPRPAAHPVPVEFPESFSNPGEAEVPDRWWETFRDADLDRLVTEALGRNLDLKVAWSSLDQAAALARQAGAAEWPAMDVVAGYGITRARSRSPITSDPSTNTVKDYLLGLQVAYEVDLWGRIRSNRKAARLDVRASEADVMATAMMLASRVAVSWYQLIQQKASHELLLEQRKISRTLLDLVEMRFKQGSVSAVDVLQQRRQLQAVEAEIPLVRMRESLLEHQLAVLLGRPPVDPGIEAPRTLPVLPPRPATGLPANLVRRRPDIRAAQVRLAAADQRVAMSIADRFPALRLTGRLETGGANTRDLFDLWLAGLAANLTAPLLDGGRRAAEVDRARAVAAQRLHQFGQTVLVALQEVEDALVQESSQGQYAENITRRMGLAREELHRSRERYVNGATDYLPVLAAIQALQLLERQELEEKRKLIEYRIDLYRALGGGWKLERPSPTGPATAETPGPKTRKPNREALKRP